MDTSNVYVYLQYTTDTDLPDGPLSHVVKRGHGHPADHQHQAARRRRPAGNPPTLSAFRDVQNAVTGDAFHGGALVGAVDLQRQVYGRVKGTLNSQMTITALRLVVGAYASVARNRARRLKAEERRKSGARSAS